MTFFGQPWDLLLIAAVLAIVVPWRGVTKIRDLLSRSSLAASDRMSMYASTMVFQWFAAIVTAWRCFGHGWTVTDLGLLLDRPTHILIVGAAVTGFLGGFQLIALRQMARIPAAQQGVLHELSRKLMPQSAVEVMPFIALVCTVSICEEFLYRGFAFALFAKLSSGSTAAAVVLSSGLFAFGHLYQGRRGLASTFVLGVIFAMARVWTGSLLPGMVAHGAVDLIAGLAGPKAARAAPARVSI